MCGNNNNNNNNNALRMQCGEDGVGSKKSGPIAYRATSGRLA